MKNKFVLTTIICFILLFVSGCAFERDADIADYNVSKEADSFKVKRRITFINLRSDEYLFSIIGNCSVQDGYGNSNHELTLICKVGESKYQKHMLYIAPETTYVVEQLDYSEVSKYDYEIVFKPKSIIPYKIQIEHDSEK